MVSNTLGARKADREIVKEDGLSRSKGARLKYLSYA